MYSPGTGGLMYFGMKCKWSRFGVRVTELILAICTVMQIGFYFMYREGFLFLAAMVILLTVAALAILILKLMERRHLAAMSQIYRREITKCNC